MFTENFLAASWPPETTLGQIAFAVVVVIVCLGTLYLWGPEWWHFKRWDHRNAQYPGEQKAGMQILASAISPTKIRSHWDLPPGRYRVIGEYGFSYYLVRAQSGNFFFIETEGKIPREEQGDFEITGDGQHLYYRFEYEHP